MTEVTEGWKIYY